MPHIDGRSGELVIRIVYDGSPEAGKTTNVKQLLNLISLQRRGASKSPGGVGRRTEFFDWLDFTGGYLDGRRVRCQLVSVPGQSSLLHRRRYLLETADAIVFVTDSRPAQREESLKNLSMTLRIVAKVARGAPVGLIVQANKQDLADAEPPVGVARSLGMAATTPVVGSIASTGEGVMETFVVAARLATDRVRTLLLEDALTDLPEVGADPDQLHAAMLKIEESHALRRRDREASEGAEQRGVRSDGDADAAHAQGVAANGASRAAPAGTSSQAPRRRNRVPVGAPPAPPEAAQISSGHVWPPVKGRSFIAEATAGRFSMPDLVQAWAPIGALEIASDTGWLLHTAERWVHADESTARRTLLSVVRRLLARADAQPQGRSLAITKDPGGWRLWLTTPRLASIGDEIVTAVEKKDPHRLLDGVGRVAAAARAFRALEFPLRQVPAGIFGMAFQQGRPVVLALDEGEGVESPPPREPLPATVVLLEGLARDDAALRGWIDREGRAVLGRALSELEAE